MELLAPESGYARLYRAEGTSRKEYDARGLRILLVEDNEMNQQVATELLESAGAGSQSRITAGSQLQILLEGPDNRNSTLSSWTCRCRRWTVYGDANASRGAEVQRSSDHRHDCPRACWKSASAAWRPA